jgi:Reverse transcriptase (RNA-dependent DNA polymerase)
MAFRTNQGTYEYVVVPFGLSVALVAFQRFITAVLKRNNTSCFTVYLDDILIFGDLDEKLEERTVSAVKSFLRFYLRANLKKFKFHKSKFKYVRFILSRKGVKITDLGVNSNLLFKKPNFAKELRRFWRLIKYLQEFV